MKKIKYLILLLLFIPFLTGCSFIDNIMHKDKKIEITYVYEDKTVIKTYKNYSSVTFEKCDTASGYEFKGWSFEEDGSVITINDLKDKEKVTLYPIINIIKYIITYNLDGGINNPSNPNFYTVEDELSISAPTKEDCAFKGWTTTTITEPVSPYVIEKGTTGNLTLNANYVHGKVSVSFDYTGIETQIIDYGTTCTKPSDPFKLGDTFLYWCSDDALETEYDFATPVTENITLYPKWESTQTYTLTIENYDLINSNHESGKQLPKGASINLSTDYIVEGYEFVGWYIDDVLVSKNYKYSFKMPNKNTKVTPMFSELETFSYVLGSKTDLNTNIEKTSNGYLFGSDIASYYNHTSNKLVIKYNGLEKLKPGLHSFIYESRLIINVFIKVNDKDITQISVDYDTNYPNATLSFNEDPNYDYYYSLDGDEYKKCYDGMSFDIANKFTGHQLDIKCEDGSPVTYTIEALPTQSQSYLNNTFTYQGETFDHYIDSEYDLKMLLEYYICSAYPEAGGTTYTFNFYYKKEFNPAYDLCSKFIAGEMSSPYGLHYSISTTGNNVFKVELSSDGSFNSEVTSQAKTDITTTQFLPSYRSDTFNDFAIEKYTKTQVVRSLYELENLSYGIKPIITDDTTLTVYNKAKEILREYVDDYMTDFEKYKAIYDYIVSYVTYDDVLVNMSGSTSQYASYTSYGALINGVAVCDGISSAYKILCLIEGLECIEVIGLSNGGGHAWNKVKLGGVWYGVDATWGRLGLGSTKVVYHDYFLINEIDLVNKGKQHYEEATYNESLQIINYNIINTANNTLTYFDLMMYDKYDLIVSSTSEYNQMYTYFLLNDVRYVELRLTNGLTASDFSSTTSYSVYFNDPTDTSIFLVKR